MGRHLHTVQRSKRVRNKGRRTDLVRRMLWLLVLWLVMLVLWVVLLGIVLRLWQEVNHMRKVDVAKHGSNTLDTRSNCRSCALGHCFGHLCRRLGHRHRRLRDGWVQIMVGLQFRGPDLVRINYMRGMSGILVGTVTVI